MKLTHTPEFFRPEKAFLDYRPDLASAFREGHILAQKMTPKLGAAPAILAITDLLQDFRPGGRLAVGGTDEVVLRVVQRMIEGTITSYYAGMAVFYDSHPFDHVSFDYHFIDQDGIPLDLSLLKAARLRLLDADKAEFMAYAYGSDGPYDLDIYYPRSSREVFVEYCQFLQEKGFGDAWVFAPHCIKGTDGTNLHPLVAEALAFFTGFSGIQPLVIWKGHLADTDWFGPLEPCWPDEAAGCGFDYDTFGFLTSRSILEDAGVAEDFCTYWMRRQLLNYRLSRTNKNASNQLIFLSDGTAPIVPNAPHVAELYEQARHKGVIFAQHDTPFSNI